MCSNGFSITALQLIDLTFFDPLVKKLHVFVAVIQTIAEDPFQEIFGQRHVVAQIKKRGFWLDHPKFSQMATGVAIFCTKGWSKRVNASQSSGVRFGFQLSANGQERRFVKEVV